MTNSEGVSNLKLLRSMASLPDIEHPSLLLLTLAIISSTCDCNSEILCIILPPTFSRTIETGMHTMRESFSHKLAAKLDLDELFAFILKRLTIPNCLPSSGADHMEELHPIVSFDSEADPVDNIAGARNPDGVFYPV